MNAVVLAAGTGRRLGNLGNKKPKALFPFENHFMIDYVLAFLNQPEIKHVVVVGGYQFLQLASYLERYKNRVRLIENKDFLKGNILSVAAALPYVSGDDFLLLNSDHLYPSSLIRKVLEGPQHMRIICDRERPLCADDMKVRWNQENQGFRLESISKTLSSYDGGYIGMTYVPQDAQPVYRQAFNLVLAKSDATGVAEEVLGEMTHVGHPPFIQLIDPLDWIEIDTPEDVMIAKNKIMSGKVVLTKPIF